MKGTLAVTGDKEADDLLNTDPLALLIGMMLDQQIPMEWAFKGPYTLKKRMDGQLEANAIASMDPDAFIALVKGPPALHRFPGSMGKRMQDCCRAVVNEYGGDASKIWEEADSGADLYARLRKLPGYGDDKSKIFIAILAKRFGVQPQGWEEAAAPFSDSTPRSVADVDSADTLAQVRAWKQMMKRQGKSKTD